MKIAESDTYIREKYARTINGTKYRPNRVTIYSAKDQTFTDLNIQTTISVSDTELVIVPTADAAVTSVMSQLSPCNI